MSISKKQQACVERWQKAHYDRMYIVLPKGSKNIIAVAAGGESMNNYIRRAIMAQLSKDGAALPERG